MTIVCGDSHTSTHGAMGALAFGIGTSEVEHVLATQTILQKPAKEHAGDGRKTALSAQAFTAKDLALAIIAPHWDGGRRRPRDRIRRRGG